MPAVVIQPSEVPDGCGAFRLGVVGSVDGFDENFDLVPGFDFEASISKSSISQNVHAQALESGWSAPSLSVAVCQDKPLFAETSTLMIARPPPDQAKPLAEV